MNALRRIGLLVVPTLFMLVVAQATVVKPPRGGLFGVSRQSDNALHAIDRLTGTGLKIGNIESTVDGEFIMGALAREPSTGILYGLGSDPVDIRLVIVNPQNGMVDNGDGGDGAIARLDPEAVVDDEFLTYFSGADYGPDGLLYAVIGIFDPEPGTSLTGPYLATVDTTPVPEEIDNDDDDGVHIVNFINVTPIGMLPATMTGISFDKDGVLWGVSPDLPFQPTLGNRLFKFGVDIDGKPDPNSVADFPLLEDGTTPPPGSGFASLQFTCDERLYAGNLETVTWTIQIQATWQGYEDGDDVGDDVDLSDFTIQYEDLDGDLRLDLNNPAEAATVLFVGISEAYGAEPESWDTLVAVPNIPSTAGGTPLPLDIAVSSGMGADGANWYVSNGDDDPVAFDADLWSYAEVFVGDPSFTLQGDGGEIFEIDTAPATTGAITRVANPPVSASGGAGLSGFAPATSCGVTNIQNAPTPTGNNVTVISIDGFEQEAFNVGTAGVTNANFCAAPDPREIVWHRRSFFSYRPLDVADLSFTGTCGDLSQVDMELPPWYRGYSGTVRIGDEDVHDVYLVVAVVQTTAQYDGPVVTLPVPESIVDFDDFETLAELCGDRDLGQRPLDLAAAVPGLGDYPNVEGDRGIVQTAQCNRPGSMTRRTTHVYPVRLDGRIFEGANLFTQTNGIRRTIHEALVVCTAPPPELGYMNSWLNAAMFAIAQGTGFWRRNPNRLLDAVQLLEQIARYAKAADFSGCPSGSNYRGNLMSRGIATAFTVFDRLYNPHPWRPYHVPADLEIPLLVSRDTDIDPLP